MSALVAIPDGARNIVYGLPQVLGFTVQSGWSGTQWAGELGALTHGFTAQIEIAPRTEDEARLWRAFFMGLRRTRNYFELDPANGKQAARPAATVLVNGAGQTGNSLVVDGGPASTAGLVLVGDVVSIGGRGFVVMADAATNGSGQATLSLEPRITTAPADNAEVRIRDPRVRFRMRAENEPGWLLEMPDIETPTSFTAHEVLG